MPGSSARIAAPNGLYVYFFNRLSRDCLGEVMGFVCVELRVMGI
jgi:hypothetical protein